MKRVSMVIHTSVFPPEHGGATSMRHVAEGLAREGVRVRVLVKMHPPFPKRIRFLGQFPRDLDAFRGELRAWCDTGVHGGPSWTFRDVEYLGVQGSSDLARAARTELDSFAPDAFILLDDSPEEGLELFEAAAESGRFVFFARTIFALPFGPHSIKPSETVAAAIRRAVKIVAVSRFAQQYIKEHLCKDATVLYPSGFGHLPLPALGRFSNRFVTMINPCPWKGSSIFLRLTRRRPDVAFAAVPSWGTMPRMLEELRRLPNVTILAETPRIDEIFAQTKVLLVPSLWQEAFGRVSPEALLRGVPVIASDLAGLRESTMDVATLIPVEPLRVGAPPGRPFHLVDWREPDNDVEPWSTALDRLLSSPEHYAEVSASGREAATRFVEGLQRRSIVDAIRPEAIRV